MPIKIVFYPAITLNGFIAKADGDSAWVTEEDERLFAEEVAKAGCVIVGRKTFEQYRGIIYPIPGATTFVCASQLNMGEHDKQRESPPEGVIYVGGDIETIVSRIHDAGFTNAVLSGGGETNGRFAEAQAIDEVFVSIYPFVFNEGLPVFGSRQIRMNLELFATRRLDSGVVHNRYRVLRF